MVYPVFAIVWVATEDAACASLQDWHAALKLSFGSILGVFSSTDFGYVRDRSDYYSGLLFAIACISALAIALQAYCFSWTSGMSQSVLWGSGNILTDTSYRQNIFRESCDSASLALSYVKTSRSSMTIRTRLVLLLAKSVNNHKRSIQHWELLSESLFRIW